MCQVNGTVSDPISLSSGVGEGSVLGPTLYTLGQICVSVVPDIVKERMHELHDKESEALSVEYADDVTGCMALDCDEDAQLSADLLMEEYQRYFSACGLCLNSDKCAIMVIRSRAKTKEIIWNDKPEEKKVKLLGVWLDSRYEFTDHVNYLVKICSYKISSIRKVAHLLTDKNLLEVVRSFVISHLTYCASWRTTLPGLKSFKE